MPSRETAFQQNVERACGVAILSVGCSVSRHAPLQLALFRYADQRQRRALRQVTAKGRVGYITAVIQHKAGGDAALTQVRGDRLRPRAAA